MIDSIATVARHPKVRRLFLLALFIALLVVFRRLLVPLICFVGCERLIGYPAEKLTARLRLGWKTAVLAVTGVILVVLGGLVAFGVGRGIRAYLALREVLPDRIAAFRATALYQSLQEHLDGANRFVDGAQHYASGAFGTLADLGHVIVYIPIAFIIAVLFLLERDELVAFARGLDPRSVAGTLLRWTGHVADAMLVTLGFQIVVAACNAVLTIPVLLLLGIPHAVAFTFMVFFSAMVPVVGNFVAGAILTILAYQAQGWLGVGVFLGLTALLGKIESYYLNPRLASRHVRLPSFVLIVSLILWEQLLGFLGLFLSFPFLFVAARLRGEFREEDRPTSIAQPVAVPAAAPIPGP